MTVNKTILNALRKVKLTESNELQTTGKIINQSMSTDEKIEIAELIKTEIVDNPYIMSDNVVKQIMKLTVPYSGKASTILGEMLRAYQLIEYKYHNDNIMIDANGNCPDEEVETAWKYIANQLCSCVSRKNIGGCSIEQQSKSYFGNSSRYKQALEDLLLDIIDFATKHPQVFKDNNIDSSSNSDRIWTMDLVDMEDDYDQYLRYIKAFC